MILQELCAEFNEYTFRHLMLTLGCGPHRSDTKVFRIAWSGLWKDSPEEMFRELRITEV